MQFLGFNLVDEIWQGGAERGVPMMGCVAVFWTPPPLLTCRYNDRLGDAV